MAIAAPEPSGPVDLTLARPANQPPVAQLTSLSIGTSHAANNQAPFGAPVQPSPNATRPANTIQRANAIRLPMQSGVAMQPGPAAPGSYEQWLAPTATGTLGAGGPAAGYPSYPLCNDIRPAPYDPSTFLPTPLSTRPYNPQEELATYRSKYAVPVQRPWVEFWRPFYTPGIYPRPQTSLARRTCCFRTSMCMAIIEPAWASIATKLARRAIGLIASTSIWIWG